MCILFVKISKTLGDYKLILAANRDESYKRPARNAEFWETSPEILGGRDMEPGREGGTWLAMSKNGKVGILLNILHGNDASVLGKKGRGFLVKDYLESSLNGYEYCKSLMKHSKDFTPFNLVTIDLLDQAGPLLTYFSNETEANVLQRLDSEGVHCFGNSLLDRPFQKVIVGKVSFSKIVEKSDLKKDKAKLLNSLLVMLKDQQTHYPDDQIDLQGYDLSHEFRNVLASLFVESLSYGTRTHTIILVDSQSDVHFQEITMKEPIIKENVSWELSQHNFKIYSDETSS